MSHENLVLAVIITRSLAAMAAIAGAVFLAWHGKEGWGWLIFLALWLGGITVSDSK